MTTTTSPDGVDLYHEDSGSGTPIVLIHGAARSGRSFTDLVPMLVEHGYRVIVPDMRGLGRSQRVPPVHPRQWVSDIAELIRQLSPGEPVVVAGVSLGSRVGGKLALEYPEIVRALVVDAPMVGLSSSGNAELNTQFAAPKNNPDDVAEYQRQHGEDWEDAVKFYFETRNGPEFQSYLTLRPDLARLIVPTLICRGDFEDAVHPIDDSFTWHAMAPSTSLWIAPGAAESSVFRGRKNEFLTILGEFLKRIGAAAQSVA